MIYAIINQKGGIGKTTTAAALVTGLSLKGKKTLVIDLDAQSNLSFYFEAEAAHPTIYEVLTGTAAAAEAIKHTKQGDIIPCSPAMATADTVITATGKEYRLKEAITPLKAIYDYIIIDTPPALSISTINALTAADRVIVPAKADCFSAQGIGQLYNTIATVKKYCNPNLTIDGILLTEYAARLNLSKAEAAQLKQTAEAIGTKVYNTCIRPCSGIKEAQAYRESIFDYHPARKVQNAIEDYTAFIDEIIK